MQSSSKTELNRRLIWSTGLRPYLEQLSSKDAELFVAEVYNELKNRYSVQKNGEIIFRFPRLKKQGKAACISSEETCILSETHFI